MRRPRLRLWGVLVVVGVAGVLGYAAGSPLWRSRWFEARGDLPRAWREAIAGVPQPACEAQLARVVAGVLSDVKLESTRCHQALLTLIALGPAARPAHEEVLRKYSEDSAHQTRALAIHVLRRVGGQPLDELEQLCTDLYDRGEATGRLYLMGGELEEYPGEIAQAAAQSLATADLPEELLARLHHDLEQAPRGSRQLTTAAFVLALRGEGARFAEATARERARELCSGRGDVDIQSTGFVLTLLALMRPQEEGTLQLALELIAEPSLWCECLALVVAMHSSADADTARDLADVLGRLTAEDGLPGCADDLALTILILDPGHELAAGVLRRQLEEGTLWRSDAASRLVPMAVAQNPELFATIGAEFVTRSRGQVQVPHTQTHLELLRLQGWAAAPIIDELRHGSLWSRLDPRLRMELLAATTTAEVLLEEIEPALDDPGMGTPTEFFERSREPWRTGLELLGAMGTKARQVAPRLLQRFAGEQRTEVRAELASTVARVAGDQPEVWARLGAIEEQLLERDRLLFAVSMLEARPADEDALRRLLRQLESGILVRESDWIIEVLDSALAARRR